MACKILKAYCKCGNERKMNVKIIVCGDEKCGKTKFIESITGGEGNVQQEEYANVFSYTYLSRNPIVVKIYEIFGGPENLVSQLTENEDDANGIIFMYAIDNRSSFECLEKKWIDKLDVDGLQFEQPCILVGNKIDLRDPRNPSHVTHREGKNLKTKTQLNGFFETNSESADGVRVKVVFNDIVGKAIQQWRDEDFDSE